MDQNINLKILRNLKIFIPCPGETIWRQFTVLLVKTMLISELHIDQNNRHP